MSSGDLCKSCKKGKLRPFQLSAFEAIVKCSNTECDSYLDFLPHETIVSTAGSASTPNSCAVSRCSSPDSPALSQYSSTDLEVATLNKSHILAKYSQKKSSLTSQAFTPSKFPSSYNAPKSALPSIAKSAFDLNDAKRYNIDLSTASLDDVDIFLDSLVGDIPSPKPSLRDSNLARGLPSDGSAFSQLPPVSKQPETFSNESIIRNDLTCLNRNLFKNRGDCVYDKLSEVCKSNIALGSSSSSSVHDSIMLDDNQFLSPAGSVVSEDSGYNDDIPIAVAVSGSGTRGGQADTKTTNSSIPSSVTQLGHDTVTVAVSQTSTLVASHSNIQRAPQTDQVAFLPAPGSCSLQSSSGNTPTQPDSVETGSITSVDSLKSTDSSTNPDIIPLPAALLLVPGLSQESELLSKLQLRPSCFRSTEEVVRNEEIGSRIIVPYAQLSLTNFLTIFEQNLATRPSVISTVSCCQKIAHQRSSPDPGDMNIKIKCPENLSDGEVSSQVSEACLSDVSESEGEFSLTDPDQHSSDSLIAGRGRPQKRKYRKRAPKHCDPVQNGNVDSSLSAQQQNIHANNENVDRLPGVQRQSSDANLPELLVNNSLPTASDGNSFQTETEAPDASRNTAGDKLLMDTRLPSVPNSVGAPTVKTKRRYGTKRKIQEEYSSAPRKSARNLANPVESRRDTSVVRASHNLSTDCQSESSSNVMLPPSLAHVRPSLAALLPPIPHHGPKHRCDGGRSNKRLKPSQPFRHLPSNVNADPWAFPVILLDQLDIEVVVQGRPRKLPAASPIPKTVPAIESTNVCVSSCDPGINGMVDGGIPRSNHTDDEQNVVVTEQSIKSGNCVVDSFAGELCSVETGPELACESARKWGLDGSHTPSFTRTVHSPQSYDNSVSNSPSSVRVSCFSTSNGVSVSNFASGAFPLSVSKRPPLCVPLRQASAHQPVLAVAPLDRSVALSNHASPSPTPEKVDGDRDLPNDSICDKTANGSDVDTNGHLKLSEATSYENNENSNLDLLQKFVDQNQSATVELQQAQEPLHKHPESINMHLSSKFNSSSSNYIEVGESSVDLSMVKHEPGLSQLQPSVVHTFPSLQTISSACSITQGQPIINGSQEPQYVVIQRQVYQVVQQSVQNTNQFIHVPTGGILDASQSINKTLPDPRVSVLQVQPPFALNYPQQYHMQQPFLPQHQFFSHQDHVTMQTPVGVGPGMLTSSPQPSPAMQAVQQPGQPAFFCQAGPHSRPRATLSSVAPDISASRASSLMTSVPETSVGQRSLPQSSSTSYRNESPNSLPPEISTCRTLKAGVISSDDQWASGHISFRKSTDSVSSTLQPKLLGNYNVKYVMSPGDTSTELVPSRRTSNVLGSSCNFMIMNKFEDNYEESLMFHSSEAKVQRSPPCGSSPPILVGHEDLPLCSSSDSIDRAVFCSQLPLSSHPPSPDSSPSSPKNFPLLGISPENSPKVAVVPSDSPFRVPQSHDLSTSPSRFPMDDSFTKSVNNSPCIKLLNYSSSPSSTMHLVLSDDESCSEKCDSFNDNESSMNDVTFHNGKYNPLCKGKLSEGKREHQSSIISYLHHQSSNVLTSAVQCDETTSTISMIPSPLQMPVTDIQCSLNKLIACNHSYQTLQSESVERSLSSVSMCTATQGVTVSECSTAVPLASQFKSVFSDQGGAALSQPCKTVNILDIPKVSAEVQTTLQPNNNLYQCEMVNEGSFLLDSCLELIAVPLEGLQCTQCNTDCWNKHALDVTNDAHLVGMDDASGQCNFLERVHCTGTVPFLSHLTAIESSLSIISLQSSPPPEEVTYNFDSLTNHDPIATFSALAKSIATPNYQRKKERSLRVYRHSKAATSQSRGQLSSEKVVREQKGESLMGNLFQNPVSKAETKWKTRCPTSVYLKIDQTNTSNSKMAELVGGQKTCGISVHCTSLKETEIGCGRLTTEFHKNSNQFQEGSTGVNVATDPNGSLNISYLIREETDSLSNKLLKCPLKPQRKQLVPSKFRLVDNQSVKDLLYEPKALLQESITQIRGWVSQTEEQKAGKSKLAAKLTPAAQNYLVTSDAPAGSSSFNEFFSRSSELAVEIPNFLHSKIDSSSKVCNSSPSCLPTSVPLVRQSAAFAISVVGVTNNNADEQLSRPPNLITETISSTEFTKCPSSVKNCLDYNLTRKSVQQEITRTGPPVFPVDHPEIVRETKISSGNSAFYIANEKPLLITLVDSRVDSSHSSVKDEDDQPSLSTNESCLETMCSSEIRCVGEKSNNKSSDFQANPFSSPVMEHKYKMSIRQSNANKSELSSPLQVNRSEKSVNVLKTSYLDDRNVNLEESSVRQSNGFLAETVDSKQLARVAYLTVAKHLKKVSAMKSEKSNEAYPAEETLPCEQTKSASSSTNGRLPSDPPAQLFTDTSNWWSSRQQAASSDEVSLASSFQKDSEPASSEDEDASVRSFGQPGRARSFTLVELPDDHHAYEELIASGYSVEKPEIRLPEGVKVLVSSEKRKHFKLKPRCDKNKNSAHSTKPVRKKLKTAKDSPKKVREAPVDCRKMAQEAVDNIVATRLPEDIPAMVIVSVKGKLFMYGSN